MCVPASRVLTAEDCRVRFAQLDQEEGPTDDDSGADQGDTARDSVVYGVAAPGVLENAGLSFAELEHKARNTKSRYVFICVVFYHVRDSPVCLDNDTRDSKNEAAGVIACVNPN